jgi:hypothetical protein
VLGTIRLSKRATVAAAGVAASALFLLPSSHASAAVVVVPCTGTNATDVAALKAAITAANIAGNQTLSLGSGCTFTLSTVDNSGVNGLPLITSTMVIQGNGDTITRSTAPSTPAFRFFQTSATGNLTITGLTLSNGGGIFEGGAIYGIGPVTVDLSTFSQNTSTGGGGGAILDSGVLTVSDSSFLSNATGTLGGAISASQIIENSAYSLAVTGSTFSGNQAGQAGGAISTDNSGWMINSTLNGNSSSEAGGFFDHAAPSFKILDVTIDGNVAATANAGGGITNAVTTAALTVTNTIVADNTNGDCGSGTGIVASTDGGHNLETGTSCGFTNSAIHVEPKLNALADNSGPTFTMELGPFSPAYDRGNPAVCAAAIPNGAAGFDQRHQPRKTIIRCDIGAYEQQRLPESAAGAAPGVPVPSTGAGTGGSPASVTGLLLACVGALLMLGSLVVVSRRRGSVA